MKRIFKIHILSLLIFTSTIGHVLAQSDWDYWQPRYVNITQRVTDHKEFPEAAETQLDVFLYWLGVHAEDRDDVTAVLDDLNRLKAKDPDGNYDVFIEFFEPLLEEAVSSGHRTLSNAIYKLLRVEERDGSYCGWYPAIWQVNRNGRALFLRAYETGWNGTPVKNAVECLIRYAILDIEENRYGLGLYLNRESRHGYIDENGYERFWEHDFVIYCESRDKFYVVNKGAPIRPIHWAFKNVQLIRDESSWWDFQELFQDATDLMNQYYLDALCEIPPHKHKYGHLEFQKLANQYGLDESVEYNKGFYGMVHGKVEILDGGEIIPASGAEVRIMDGAQTWEVKADENGYYECKDAILHKDCSPFYIKAVHKGDWVNDTYTGILEKPDPDARLEKNLLIKRNREYKWFGSLDMMHSNIKDCIVTEGDADGSINKKYHYYQRVMLDMKVKDESLLDGGLAMLVGDNMTASGNVNCILRSEYESSGKEGYTHTKEFAKDIFTIHAEDLVIQIFKEQQVPAEFLEAHLNRIKEVGENDPEKMQALLDDMEAALSGENQDQFAVRVIIHLNKVSTTKMSLFSYRMSENSGQTPTSEEDYEEIDMVLPILLSWTLEGVYVKNENGEDKIVATLVETKMDESGDKNCLPLGSITNSFTFTLERKRMK